MLFGADWLSNVFLFVFLFGLVFTVASLVLGFAGGGHVGHDAGGHGLDVHVGGHEVHVGGHDAHADVGHDGPGILNMPTIMAFLTWFGGAGYIFRSSLGWNGYLAAALALISGVAGGAIMFGLLARVLWPMMTKPLANADYERAGTPARVVSAIREGGVGEIVYTKSGSRFTAGARSIDGTAIERGAEVVIIRYEKGMAYVQDVESLLDTSNAEQKQAV